MRAGRAGRARQASVNWRGAQGARGVQASGRAGAGAGGRAGARGAQAGRRQRARQAQAWARGARGLGVPVRSGWACWLVSWASFGAQCTWLSFDSVFGPVRLGIFLSHIMNTVHCKINFRKKKYLLTLIKIKIKSNKFL